MPQRPPQAPPIEIEADFPEEEIARRRDEVVRRMLNTPHEPQAKAKKPRAKKTKKAPAKA